MQPKQPVDLVVQARWVLPIAPRNVALPDHAVAVADGRIVAIGPAEDLARRFEPRERVVYSHHALLPGFVNAHTQAATVLFRGLPVRAPLLRWLREAVSPAEDRSMSPDFVRDGTLLAMAELLRAGITTFADHYLFPEETARVAAQARMRAVIGLPVCDTPTAWAEDADACLAKGEPLWDEYKADPWVSLYFAPQAPYAVSDSTLTRVRTLADELEARVAMPVHETEVEVRDSIARDGKRPLQRLADLGLLRPGFSAVHANRLDEADLELIQRTGISVITCPQSSLRLGSGVTPLRELAARDVVVGLGSANAATAGALDLLAEARAAALLASHLTGDPAAVSPEEVLRMATLCSASALGLGSEIGSIEPAKAADLVAVDLASLSCQPADNPFNALVYAATRQQVSDVWISGRHAVAGGRLLAFDEQELLELSAQWEARTTLIK